MPIKRNVAQGTVAQTIAEFTKRDGLVLVVSPEGTRQKVTRWKTGFYHIAHGAGVPICPISLDYAKRRVNLHPVFIPTGDLEGDIEDLRAIFRDVAGKFPHKT